jgi:hypothetical protein
MRTLCCVLFMLALVGSPAAGGIPDLTRTQRWVLESADDDADFREPAFHELVEHVQTWTDAESEDFPGDIAVRYGPDIASMLDDPDGSRGDVVYLAGTLIQQHRYDPPYDTTVEWFLRLDDDTPVMVYVVGVQQVDWREGQRIEIFARFFKRISATARDGETRAYAAFVGAFPRVRAGAHADVWRAIIILGVVVGALLVLLLVTRRWSRRAAATRQPGRRLLADDLDASEDEPSLPDDPADALAEMKRRHLAPETTPDDAPRAR